MHWPSYRDLLILTLLATCHTQIAAQDDVPLYPASSALSASERFLLVPDNRGFIHVVDVGNSTRPVIVNRSDLGGRFSHIVRRPGDNRFLVTKTDNEPQLLEIQVDLQTGAVSVLDQCRLALSPRQIAVNPRQTECVIASLWARRLNLVQLTPDGLGEATLIDLPFAPGPLVWLDDEHVVAADAFSDRLALIDCRSAEVTKVWQRGGRRIGGMWLSDGHVVFTDVKLSSLAHTVESDIHWGLLMSNEIRGIAAATFLDLTEPLPEAFIPRPLGGPGEGKGDPTDLVISQGVVVAVLQGVNQIAFGSLDDQGFSYVYTGAKPGGLTVDRQGTTAYVCNALDESLSIIDLERQEVAATLPLADARPKHSLVRRGERLFFDASLSHDGWMSCHSCHVQGHSNFLLNDNHSDQSFGAPKRVLSLLGHADTLPLAWNGSMKSFDEQVRNSIEVTMQSDQPADAGDVRALVAFLKSLPPPPPLRLARGERDPDLIATGEKVFLQANCQRCHAPPSLTSTENFDVQMPDELGQRHFNPPSLIGVSQRDRFFHDGRANSLREVFVDHAHPGDDTRLSEQQLNALIEYLRDL